MAPAAVADRRSRTIARNVLLAIGLVMVVAVLGAIGVGVVLWRIFGHPQADLVEAVLRRDETLRNQVCQRRTSEIGHVELENVTEAPVPGHSDQTRATATLILHPPGVPVCRAPVRFDSHEVQYANPSYQGPTSTPHGPPEFKYATVIVEIQVGANRPVQPPLPDL